MQVNIRRKKICSLYKELNCHRKEKRGNRSKLITFHFYERRPRGKRLRVDENRELLTQWWSQNNSKMMYDEKKNECKSVDERKAREK